MRQVGLAAVTLAAATVVALLVVKVSASPPASDLVALTAFLLMSGGVTMILGIGVAHFGLPKRFRSFRAQMVVASSLMAILALANVGVVAYLMFLSPHDLALLGGLLAFSVSPILYPAYPAIP